MGRALAWIGDTRLGVGCTDDGIPVFDLMPIAVPKPWQRSEMVSVEGSKIFSAVQLQQKPDGRLGMADFSISRYPVTNAQFERYAQDNGIRRPRWSYPNHPRTDVSWEEAMAYCAWLTEQLRALTREDGGISPDTWVRLPTEWEWQYAAAGQAQRDGAVCSEGYAWGDSCNADQANVSVGDTPLSRTSAVGLYPAGAEGAPQDTIGNVFEWCFNKEHGPESNDALQPQGGSRALRGGSFALSGQDAALGSRRLNPFVLGNYGVGFRVVFCSAMPSDLRPPNH